MLKQSAKINKVGYNQFLFWLLSLLLLSPWIYFQHQTSINSDTAWLSICAQRLISGGSMLQECYDTNPPLNILIYVPFIWFSDLLNISLYKSLFWITLLWIFCSVFITRKTLNSFPSLNQNDKNVISLALLCSLTIVPSLYFTERDHFTAIMILPLILVQIAYTYEYKLSKIITYSVLILGGITLFLKPHFGIISIFLLLHRMIVQKRFFIVKDTDFIILFAITLIYIAVIFLFFKDFVYFILPDVIDTYLYYNDRIQTYKTAMPYFFIIIANLIALIFIKDKSKPIILSIIACAILALIAYIIQMKGFTYQRLPLNTVLLPITSIIILKLISTKTILENNVFLSYFFAIIIFLISYFNYPIRPNFPSHAEYINNPITNYIEKNCDKPCSFYISYENMDIVSQLAFYSDFIYATRFPTFWFLINIDDNDIKKRQRFANYIIEDINKYNPSLLLILSSSPELDKIKGNKTVIEYFAFSHDFKKTMKQYQKIDNLTVDRAIFYKDTPYDFPYILKWDVYKRVKKSG